MCQHQNLRIYRHPCCARIADKPRPISNRHAARALPFADRRDTNAKRASDRRSAPQPINDFANRFHDQHLQKFC